MRKPASYRWLIITSIAVWLAFFSVMLISVLSDEYRLIDEWTDR